MCKLRDTHQVWFVEGGTKKSKALKDLAKAVKDFEKIGVWVESATMDSYHEDGVTYYTGLIVVDVG